MKIIKEVKFEEVLEYFDLTHPVRPEGNFTTNDWARNLIVSTNEQCGGQWKIVELMPEDILEILLPHHRGEPDLGGTVTLIEGDNTTVKNAIIKLSQLSDYHTTNTVCWNKIQYWMDKEIEPIFLSTIQPKHMLKTNIQGEFYHLDGLHRLLAWGLKGSKSSIKAFLVG